ncbi:LacI family DNA-binding transcriptional regulator [Wenyingzhuangia marina]|uniref:Transcriptional regulator, LacI family n=1 Tax=Wenyingzhuangia marina TaxID=1195760 RepID=A0A1M5T8Y3_9FLAO|nr:LacI family DNA-binding transcriptional regulator [Wenyingzhuangia marina]GGF65865.1 LacI family transcriptional regulator [Wenyingzhuangia marina]SHH47227.1 transcriptional regulator, LacI family [Wenyingzhuangia marina]
MSNRITLKQIAKELNLSVSTVSKSLRNSREISTDTKNLVQAFAKFYNYKPNSIALNLRNRKSKTIGVIIPEITHYFFSNVIAGIDSEANKKGYRVVVSLSNESFDTEVVNIETLANGSVDGFILSVAKETLLNKDYHHFKETINQGMPIVMFDRITNEVACDKVIIDDKEGAKKAVNKLLNTGCKKIALVTTEDYVTVGSLRTKGYIEALEESNIAYDPNLVIKIQDQGLNKDEEITLLGQSIVKLLHQHRDIDAFFAVNELSAITVMKVVLDLGYKVPEDISIIAFTDGVLSKYSIPALTTVSQHAFEMGVASAKLLIDKIEEITNSEFHITQTMDATLIERQTTK